MDNQHAFKLFFILATVAGALLVLSAMSGCAYVGPVVDGWLDSQTATPPDVPVPEVPDVVVPDPPAEPEPPAIVTDADEAPFAAFDWTYGGFGGGGAILTSTRISGLSVSNGGLRYAWETGNLRDWGIGNDDDYNGALACLFVLGSDGQWRGGKFDWISTSRTSRDFDNVHDGYNGWSMAGVPSVCQAAFVIVSADGRKRTNVIVSEWRQ